MKSGAEILKNYCFINENEYIDIHDKSYIRGMIMALYLNNIITNKEANAARQIITAICNGMHPEYANFYK